MELEGIFEDFSPVEEGSSQGEVLQDNIEIFSCGGIYLPQSEYDGVSKRQAVHMICLPGHEKETLVFKNFDLVRRGEIELQSVSETGKTGGLKKFLHRVFKEDLN